MAANEMVVGGAHLFWSFTLNISSGASLLAFFGWEFRLHLEVKIERPLLDFWKSEGNNSPLVAFTVALRLSHGGG